MISTNPQHSSSQQEIHSTKEKNIVKGIYACGNVCESDIAKKIWKLPTEACEKLIGHPKKKGPACKRQVFATMEVAESTARALKGQRIDAHPFRCEDCGLVHLSEVILA